MVLMPGHVFTFTDFILMSVLQNFLEDSLPTDTNICLESRGSLKFGCQEVKLGVPVAAHLEQISFKILTSAETFTAPVPLTASIRCNYSFKQQSSISTVT